jgi:hypothetical protein
MAIDLNTPPEEEGEGVPDLNKSPVLLNMKRFSIPWKM